MEPREGVREDLIPQGSGLPLQGALALPQVVEGGAVFRLDATGVGPLDGLPAGVKQPRCRQGQGEPVRHARLEQLHLGRFLLHLTHQDGVDAGVRLSEVGEDRHGPLRAAGRQPQEDHWGTEGQLQLGSLPAGGGVDLHAAGLQDGLSLLGLAVQEARGQHRQAQAAVLGGPVGEQRVQQLLQLLDRAPGIQEAIRFRLPQAQAVRFAGLLAGHQEDGQVAEEHAGLAPQETAEAEAIHGVPGGVHQQRMDIGPGILRQRLQGIHDVAHLVPGLLERQAEAFNEVAMTGDGEEVHGWVVPRFSMAGSGPGAERGMGGSPGLVPYSARPASTSQRSASMAAMQPLPAAVMACR